MSTDIYYFSGTGNSLFVAKELQKRISESNIIPIASLMTKTTVDSSADVIGFVFPVHALTIPIVVRKFIQKLNMINGKYIFAVATREGTVFRGFEKIDQLLKKKKRRLSSHFILQMYNNDSRHGSQYEKYIVPTKSEILALEKVVLEQLDLIKEIIITKGIRREKDTNYTIKTASNPILGFLIEKIVIFLMNIAEYFGGANYFYYDDKCTGCGICERVCLSKKIKMVDQKPTWQKDILCYMCFACLNFCPKVAVQIHDIPGVKSYSKENGRYPHPYATVNDIAKQKLT
jgi:ferredoxin/flavodoxin